MICCCWRGWMPERSSWTASLLIWLCCWRGCITRLELRARGADVALGLDLPPAGLPTVIGDGDRLVQLFTNLLDNALKHTPAGGRVAVNGRHDDGQVIVSVADTGPGIPADQLSRIFERFYQVDKSRSRSGSTGAGLGLAICKELARGAQRTHCSRERGRGWQQVYGFAASDVIGALGAAGALLWGANL